MNSVTGVEDPDVEDDFYDEQGNCSSNGLFDAGGHMISYRWAEYTDVIFDQIKDKR